MPKVYYAECSELGDTFDLESDIDGFDLDCFTLFEEVYLHKGSNDRMLLRIYDSDGGCSFIHLVPLPIEHGH